MLLAVYWAFILVHDSLQIMRIIVSYSCCIPLSSLSLLPFMYVWRHHSLQVLYQLSTLYQSIYLSTRYQRSAAAAAAEWGSWSYKTNRRRICDRVRPSVRPSAFTTKRSKKSHSHKTTTCVRIGPTFHGAGSERAAADATLNRARRDGGDSRLNTTIFYSTEVAGVNGRPTQLRVTMQLPI